MKRIDTSTECTSAKRHHQQQPPLSTVAVTPTYSSGSTAADTTSASVSHPTQPSQAMSAPHSASFSATVLDNIDIFDLVASLLCYRGIWRGDATDDSPLHLARCCHRAYSLVMRDGPWWKQQLLFLKMKGPLITFNEWVVLSHSDDTMAVMKDSFGSRQQKIVRRLVGDEVYEREVAPKLSEERNVMEELRREKRHLATVGYPNAYHEYTVINPTGCSVYSQLTPAFFDNLVQHLPERSHHIIMNDLINVYEDDDDICRNEPFCQWLLGCWDAALLPKCAQWITRATINVDMLYGLPQPYQTACLIHALSRMSGVTQLSLLWEGEQVVTSKRGMLMSVSELTDILPKLASLHISRLPLYPDMIDSLVSSSALLHLRLSDVPVFGYYEHESMDASAFLDFEYGRVEAVQLNGLRADEQHAKRTNRRLRLALCEYWERQVLESLDDLEHLLTVSRAMRQQLQAEQDEDEDSSGGEDGEDSEADSDADA